MNLTKIKWRNFGRKRHCLAKLTLYEHICHVSDGLYASWRVKSKGNASLPF